jgi:hypothetical protein
MEPMIGNISKSKILLAGLGALVCCGLLACSASAAYRQVGNFAGTPGELKKEQGSSPPFGTIWPEQVQLGGASGLAVNYTGAGGVPAGTVYAAVEFGGGTNQYIVQFKPEKTSGTMKFAERWRYRSAKGEEEEVAAGRPPYVRCGPEGESAEKGGPVVSCDSNSEASGSGAGVAIDQTTGNVYTYFNQTSTGPGQTAITVYNATGSEVISRFGEIAPVFEETIAESPSKVHHTQGTQPLAVNAAGKVYLFDVDSTFFHRLMVFKPKNPGIYTAYEYAGQANDVAAGAQGVTNYPMRPVTDAAGSVYVSNGEQIEKYDPLHPGQAPVCSFFYRKGSIGALAVNALTDEVFFGLENEPVVHALSPCSGAKMTETGTTAVSPTRKAISALAVNPTLQFEPGLPPGVLFGASPSGEGGEAKGTFPTAERESAIGYVFAPASEVPPEVMNERISSVTAESARLEAEVNPRANASRYVFQVITDAAFRLNQSEGHDGFVGARESPAGGAAVSGAQPVRVAVSVAGLQAGTSYRFRVVAHSFCLAAQPTQECVGSGGGRSFDTYASNQVGLPDERVYEMVSPVKKEGGQVFPPYAGRTSCSFECKPGKSAAIFPQQSAPNGEAVIYEGEPFGPGAALIENEYMSRRTGEGWQTTSLAPGRLINRGDPQPGAGGYKAFDPSLSKGILLQGLPSLTASALSEFKGLYTQSTTDTSTFESLLTQSNAEPSCKGGSGEGSLLLGYLGASTDLSRVFFEANDSLTPDSTGICGQTNLYEWTAGILRPVNVLPGGTGSTPGATIGSGNLSGNGIANPAATAFQAISADGNRVFFTGADGHLYARSGGTTTLEIAGPANCDVATPLANRVCFLASSRNGDRALVSNGQIYGLNQAGNAYEPVVDLTQGKGGFLGISGQTDDLTQLYFVDSSVLTGVEENDQGAVAVAGEANLYVWKSGATHFIGTMQTLADGSVGPWSASLVARNAEASPDGRYFTFQSLAPLTGASTIGECLQNEAVVEVGPCPEVYLYDSQSQTLTCPSCNPSGAKPVGPSYLAVKPTLGSSGYLPQSYYLTNTGRLVFESSDHLAPGDTNGRGEDVYEYEPAGVGSCQSTQGCVFLLSSGQGQTDSNFVAMDPTGDNVFFVTRDRLVNSDVDGLIDLYDARVGGGFAELGVPGECKGESCQTALSPSPLATPSSNSTTPEAAGIKCKKGQVKQRGKCVKKPQKSKHKKKQGGGSGAHNKKKSKPSQSARGKGANR